MAKSRAAKRKKKLSKGKIIFLVVAVLIIVAALVALWYFKPDVLNGIIASLMQKDDPSDQTGGIGTGTGQEDNPYVTGDTLQMTVLDIGQGDCIYIAFPDGKNMVMDIGSEFGSTSPWEHANEFLQQRNVTQIDYLFITHGDYDHIRDAKKLLDNYEIKSLYMPLEKAQDSNTWLDLLEAAENGGGIEKWRRSIEKQKRDRKRRRNIEGGIGKICRAV